ncbi:MAG: 2-oxo acid dehydrogenase subunit E2 [Spirochaetia bacterium]
MRESATVESFPFSRLATSDVGVISRNKHHITGLFEVDVTVAREQLRRMRRAGYSISFTSWFVKSVAQAIEEMPEVHGILHGRRRRVVFDEVDVALMVERVVENEPVPLPLVLCGCNKSSLGEIESQIQAATTQSVEGARDYQLGRRRSPFLMAFYYRLPQALRLFTMRWILKNPFRRKAAMGTTIVTSVAAGLRFPGWVVPRSMHNLVFGVGSVVRKPLVVRENVLPRDVLHLTVLLDHDVVDGAPAARFVSRLVKILETAAALPPE